MISNLQHYCQEANQKVEASSAPLVEARKKLFLVNAKHSHHEEIDERLQFIKYLASITDFKISKVELGTIYEMLLTKSLVASDQEEFLLWCKSCCEQSSSVTVILDLNEVGAFFTEKMNNKELNLKNMLLVGFDFLQQYFLSANEKEGKLLKTVRVAKPKFTTIGYSSFSMGYGPMAAKGFGYGAKAKEEEEDTTPIFKVIAPPSELEQLDIVWNMALQCENEKVVPKAIDFLMKVYSSLDEGLAD